jgi:hypothetical protein
MTTPTPATNPGLPPTASGWTGRQRHLLRASCRATPSQRRRTSLPAETAVLLYALSRLAPVSLRPGEIGAHTGLSPDEVGGAVADLEAVGWLEPGSARTGRLGLVTPEVLGLFGLEGYGLELGDVRDDVRPAGYPAEQSADALAEAFA